MGQKTSSTQILLVTAREDLTADLLAVQLRQRGAGYFRLNLDDFPSQTSIAWTPDPLNRTLRTSGDHVQLSSFRSAWFRRIPALILPSEISDPGIKSFLAKEAIAFLDGLWSTTECCWVNQPAKVSFAENKITQLSVANYLGFQLPKTIVTNDPKRVREFARSSVSLIAKPIAATGVQVDEDYRILYSELISHEELMRGESIRFAPFILQERIPRAAEIRVTVVGVQVFSAKITLIGSANEIPDWHLADRDSILYERHDLPVRVRDLCLQMTKWLGLVYSTFDFILTPLGDYVFLETNPSGQWGWIEHETNAPITAAIANVLISGGVQ